MLIPSRTLQYYWLKFTRRWRSRTTATLKKTTIKDSNINVNSFS